MNYCLFLIRSSYPFCSPQYYWCSFACLPDIGPSSAWTRNCIIYSHLIRGMNWNGFKCRIPSFSRDSNSCTNTRPNSAPKKLYWVRHNEFMSKYIRKFYAMITDCRFIPSEHMSSITQVAHSEWLTLVWICPCHSKWWTICKSSSQGKTRVTSGKFEFASAAHLTQHSWFNDVGEVHVSGKILLDGIVCF